MSPAQALSERGELTNRSWTILVHCPTRCRAVGVQSSPCWPLALGPGELGPGCGKGTCPGLASWSENLERPSLMGAGAVGGNGQRWQLPGLGLHSGGWGEWAATETGLGQAGVRIQLPRDCLPSREKSLGAKDDGVITVVARGRDPSSSRFTALKARLL